MPTFNHPRIVLAEDERSWRELLASHLRRAGYEVLELADGTQLCEFVRRVLHDGSELPDAVVSDFHLPGADGLSALASWRLDDDLTPFVLMTAFASAATWLTAARLGAQVLDKPFDPTQLVALLARLAPIEAG